jgi:hypothetical protein
MPMRTLVAMLLLCAMSWAATAQAAGWDCPAPTGIAEPVRCGDATLAALEAQVTTLLTAASGKLSVPGRTQLRADQAEWRKYLAALCLGELQPGAGGVVDCLKQEYDRRRVGLARAVETAAGLTLRRNERFAARSPRAAEDAAHPVRTEIGWPEIDHATTPAQRRWNETVAKYAEQLATPLDPQDPDTDIEVDYRIESVGADLIQTVFSRDLYIHGAAHGDDMTVSSLFLLPAARQLQAEDLFDPAKNWQDALAGLAYRALAGAAHDGAWRLWPRRPAELIDLVTEPGRWLLNRDGLAVHFDAYDVAGYAAGTHDVVIPWTALNTYLQTSLPLHLPPR